MTNLTVVEACDMCGVVAEWVAGCDVCLDCYKAVELTEVECSDCDHEWDAERMVWDCVALCPTCEAEDAPWAEGDRLRAEAKER